jgi:antitoxin component YwqK of YwqJK toxin-antitoxin module
MNVINFLKFVGDKRPEYAFEKQLIKMKVNGTIYPYSGKGTIDDEGKKNGQFESYAFHQEPGVARWMDKKNALETGEGIYLQSVFNYKDGRTEGKQTTYYENGQIESEYFYVGGNKSGDEKEYHENGQLKSRVTYENGIKDGLEIAYNQDGKIVREANWYRGNKHGLELVYTEDGKRIIKKVNWDMNMISGPYEEYWPNGNPRLISSYKDNNNQGDTKYYYKDGTLKILQKYDNHNIVKYKCEYHPSGGKDYEQFNGETHIKFKVYYENGDNVLKQQYYKDKHSLMLDGEYIEYNRDGSVKQKFTYSDNRVIK